MVPGRTLTEPDWLSARIAEMGRSWGATEPRVSGTLWWCMVASALVEQLARAYANDEVAPEPFLDRLDCEVRPDGGIERVRIVPAADIETAAPPPTTEGSELSGAHVCETADADRDRGALDRTDARAQHGPEAVALPGSETGPLSGPDADLHEASDVLPDAISPARELPGSAAVIQGDVDVSAPREADDAALSQACANALRETLAAVIGPVAAVSGAGVPSLWAIAADAIGNRALDAGNPQAGVRLASEVGGKLPVPRFVEVGGRSFVRRISCCLVFEVPGCEMCTSCPKRPAAERKALLAQLAAES
ncbi:(2Fe-2S)-binding protein [Nocardia nepalensis]|uniref:(2Fe-2S)-binding protein n=1 Tax=Nocardia nepalensis TaxID=3375448 RepID=UPI003B66B27E